MKNKTTKQLKQDYESETIDILDTLREYNTCCVPDIMANQIFNKWKDSAEPIGHKIISWAKLNSIKVEYDQKKRIYIFSKV